MEKYCVSVDWLQVYCTCNHLEGNFVQSAGVSDGLSSGVLYIKKEDMSTALWLSVYSLYIGTLKVATLCADPRSSTMDKQGVTLKLENRVLYSMQYISILYRIMDELHLTYKGITRIDVCYDCNRLRAGMSVSKFLYDYIAAPPYQQGHIIRSGSRRFAVHGKRSTTGAMEINSMRWGSQASAIGAYCYNKSLELLEVKDKPWIREVWEKNGLINEWDDTSWRALSDKQRNYKVESGDSSSYLHTSVWRFEISIKCKGMDLLNMDSGELFRLSPSYLQTQQAIEKLFFVYAGKAFDFRQSTGQRTIREYPKMEIFEHKETVSSRPYAVSRFADTGRTEKMCYNKLLRLSEEYGDLSAAQQSSIQSAMDFLLSVSGKKAGTIRLLRQTGYLRAMRAQKFIEEDDMIYLGAMEAARIQKRDIDAEFLYDNVMSLVRAVRMEEQRECASLDAVDLDSYPYGLIQQVE